MPTLEVLCDIRIDDGKGIVCHGLEFSLAILRESLEKFEARQSVFFSPNSVATLKGFLR